MRTSNDTRIDWYGRKAIGEPLAGVFERYRDRRGGVADTLLNVIKVL